MCWKFHKRHFEPLLQLEQVINLRRDVRRSDKAAMSGTLELAAAHPLFCVKQLLRLLTETLAGLRDSRRHPQHLPLIPSILYTKAIFLSVTGRLLAENQKSMQKALLL